jgi:polyisoprenoid-binding protein YceI
MAVKKNKNFLTNSFDKLAVHPKFTLGGVSKPVTSPFDISANPTKIRKGSVGKKARTYYSEVTGGDYGERI